MGDAPFSAGQPFQLEAVEDDSEGLAHVVQDFWRRHIAYPARAPIAAGEPPEAGTETASLPPTEPTTPVLADYLVQRQDSPTKLAALLKAVLGQPLAEIQWPDDLDQITDPESTEIQATFQTAQNVWQNDAGLSVVNELHRALNEERLKKTSYSPDKIDQGFQEWAAWFASMNPTGGHHRIKDNKLSLYRQDRLGQGQGTKKT